HRQMTSCAWIDTHAHLDDPAFDPDRDHVLADAAAAGVRRVINVGYRPLRWDSTIELTRTYPLVWHMLGLHPGHADEWSPETRDQLTALVRSTSPVAIGEIGLDYFRDGPSPALQAVAFHQQVEIATEDGLPIVIHQRAAEDDLITALTRVEHACQVLLHSFEGTNRLATVVNDRGFYVGVGGLATRAGSEWLRQTLRTISLDRIVLETDSPYLVPAGVKERRNSPANIPLIAERLAPMWNVDQAAFATATTRNAERLFGPLTADGHRGPTESLA
ncbi:MAG: TatD family hydrolase, partial [Chloroflexota bacterium]|nr:TatD family hydrolase [Chloroflexota bacterium]